MNAYQSGRYIHQAWDKPPFIRGARKIADIQLTELYQECLADMPVSDLEASGGLWASKEEFISLFSGPEQIVWVVRFQLIRVMTRSQPGNL